MLMFVPNQFHPSTKLDGYKATKINFSGRYIPLKSHTKTNLNDMCLCSTHEFPINNKMIKIRFLNMHLWFLSIIVGIYFFQYDHNNNENYVLTIVKHHY